MEELGTEILVTFGLPVDLKIPPRQTILFDCEGDLMAEGTGCETRSRVKVKMIGPLILC